MTCDALRWLQGEIGGTGEGSQGGYVMRETYIRETGGGLEGAKGVL